MISGIVISILSLLVVILGYTTFNLLRKLEKMEDTILSYNNYIIEFSKQIEFTEKRLKEIDEKGMFEGDDEIGWFFKEIKVIQSKLSNFKLN